MRLKCKRLDCEVIALCDHANLFVVFKPVECKRFDAGSSKAFSKCQMLCVFAHLSNWGNDLFGFRVEAQNFIQAIETFEPKAQERA